MCIRDRDETAWAHLKDRGAFSDDAFYVEPSYATMERLWVLSMGEDGGARWGIPAAKAASLSKRGKKTAKTRPSARTARNKARKPDYYPHSPRLLTLGNLEEWPPETKNVINAILAERTPESGGRNGRLQHRDHRRGGSKALRTMGGRAYAAFNGSRGYGYRVRTWINRAGLDLSLIHI